MPFFQAGGGRTWHFSEEAIVVKRVSLSGQSRKHLLAVSLSHLDRTLTLPRKQPVLL
jgi:hypothetical protein